MAELPVPRSKINQRLKKIEGQVRGISKMVEQERECKDILIQLAAANSAMQSVAALVLRNYASICATRESNEEMGADLAHAVSIWLGRGNAFKP
jgi:CsoR family transcriptional regulator, copper-sensing transcriptional repressor